MEYEICNYRYAQEIIEHPNYEAAIEEITQVVTDCPLFTWPNKSANNENLDVVQQLLNAYFDVKFHSQNNWEFHPDATNIPGSSLKADFRKSFAGLTIQTEVQFGNMARWYSDVFKFQTAYSQNMVNMGLCIIPFQDLARRIDSNITNYERCVREIESAKMSITLPILLIGIKLGDNTAVVDVSTSQFETIQAVTGSGNSDNLYRVVNAHISGIDIQDVSIDSPIGDRP